MKDLQFNYFFSWGPGLVIIALLAFSTPELYAQGQKLTYKGFPSLVWPKLYKVTFITTTDQHGDFQKPVFTAVQKALDGKTVTVPGYIVPFDSGLKSRHFMFSSLPLNACFFCGVGGPETVIEVYCIETVTYTDKPVQLKGRLKLNDTDPDKMMYILENAEVLGGVGP